MSRTGLDLIVIGAGAAGLAAGRRAQQLGLAVLILEAKERIGGRAYTDTASLGVLWDRGAQWLHHAEGNPFARLADALGFRYQRTPAARRLWTDGWADPALQAELEAYQEHAFAAVHAAGGRGLDVPAADVLPPHARFRPLFDGWFAALAGVDPERMSTLDFARYAVSGQNWRLLDGYGALLAHYGAGLPVELATPALRIGWGGPQVAVETARGTLSAPAAIVTVSTSVLAGGRPAFDPPLPPERAAALAAVPVGEANKVALALEPGALGLDEPCLLHFEHHPSIRFELRPSGRTLAIGYLGGRFAAELEAAGPDAMTAFATERLVEVFGGRLRRQILGAASTAWCGDPDILGGYSCARPGLADQRPRLAEPLAGRLFFAGEACSLEAYGTVHGAALSGQAAVDAAVAARPGRA